MGLTNLIEKNCNQLKTTVCSTHHIKYTATVILSHCIPEALYICTGYIQDGVCVSILVFIYIPFGRLFTADFSDEDFGFDGHTPLERRELQRGYIGLPSQRKTSNCDVSVKNRPQQGREAEGAHSSFCDTDK